MHSIHKARVGNKRKQNYGDVLIAFRDGVGIRGAEEILKKK